MHGSVGWDEDSAAMVEVATQQVEQYGWLKLYAGRGELDADLDRLQAVRDAVGPEIGLFVAVRDQSLKLDDALVEVGRDRYDVRRIAQFVLDARWPFESEGRYRDTIGRLAGSGFDEVTVHWARPDGHGIAREALPHLAAVHSSAGPFTRA